MPQRLMFTPTFNGDLDESAAALCDFALITGEAEVPVTLFVIQSGHHIQGVAVEQGRYRTALFLFYCAVLAQQTEFVFTSGMRGLLPRYYGDKVIDQAREEGAKHIALHALLEDGVRIKLELQPGYELPDSYSRTAEELIRFAWSVRDELSPGCPAPLIRQALTNLYLASLERGFPVIEFGDQDGWPSREWLKRARELRQRLAVTLPIMT